MISVVIADDHHLVRRGIRLILEEADDIAVVGEAQDGQEAVAFARELEPEVLVIDISMPRLNGGTAIEYIVALDVGTEVIVLSVHSDDTVVRRALHSGARGYVLKRSVAKELVRAVRAASRGEEYLSPELSDQIADEIPGRSRDIEVVGPIDQLTPREQEVLQLLAEGHTTRRMGRMLNISVKTVEKHRSNVRSKLDTYSIAGLTRLAVDQGLVSLDR